MSLKTRFRAVIALAMLGLVVVAGSWLIQERSRLLHEKKEKLRNLVETAHSILTQCYQRQQHGMSQAEAQRQAIGLLRNLRYAGDNYFWINDLRPTMVMHPTKPDLEGTDLSSFKDPNGKALFVEMADTVRNSGAGFVAYEWPRPGTETPVPKLSYVKGFEPWAWIVGTGIYVDDVNVQWRKSATQAAVVMFVLLILIGGAGLQAYRRMFIPLNEMVGRMKDVAEGEGDLTKRLEVPSDREVAELAGWFNAFVGKLEETFRILASNTKSLAAAGEEISATAHQQAQGAERQKDQTAQVATAMQEMASTVQEVSDNCSKAATASQSAAESARQGGKVVEETLSHMHRIAQSVSASATKVEELGKRAEQIGQIIGVIDDISDQTNLLALNAAIEAARAGERGRGFAVVADEVRKLAERTGKATKEISGMIHGIQDETKKAVEGMQAGTKEVEQGVELTTQAGSSLQDIIRMSQGVGDMIAQIATASAEQSAASEEINGNIDQIAKIAANSAAGAEQTTGALRDLSALATNLQNLVDRFQTGSHANDGGARKTDTNQSQAPAGDRGNPGLDFARVKMAHRSWRLKLRGFLDGRESLNPGQLASHQTCELGKWIYSEGMAAHSGLSAFRELEKRHQAMHGLVKRVVELKLAGKVAEAEAGFLQVVEAAEEVVALLNKVEISGSHPRALATASGK